MMGSFLRLFFLTTLSLALSWSSFLLIPSFARRVVSSDAAWYTQAFPDRSMREYLLRPQTDRAFSVAIDFLGPEAQDAMISAWPLVRRHLRVAGDGLPFFSVFIVISILAGLFVRERLWLGTTYASPAASFVAKRLVGAVVLSFIVWCLAPVPAPYWVFYPLILSGMVGFFVYLSNLPLRL